MADHTKEEVLALAEWINSKARHEQSTGGCDKLTSAATALRALAKSMDAAPVGYIGRIGLLSLEPDVGFAEISKQRDAVYHTPLFVAPPASAPAEPVAGGALEDVVEWHKKEIADLEGKIERNNAYKRKVGSHDDSANERCRSAIHHHRWSIDAVLRIRSALAEQPAPVAVGGAAAPAAEDLLKLIRWAYETLYEINPSNYDHDEVCRLNDASVEVILGLKPLAAPQPASQNGEER